ncbi:PIG-L deacetylase family protein [Lysobacter korlensis]|uniref:PIG-L deacetylase family protein n=1 Tax=Lysobacter korlensis TaxID=553636 RepID=A0ABV6RJC0_9GAMM
MVVFLFAHPDDEFACSMWIRGLVRQGRRVTCAYLTDGGFGGQATARRESESLRALAMLGVRAADVRFLGREHGLRDGQLHSRLQDGWEVLMQWLDGLGEVQSIVVPAWEGGHQDHDAVHLLGVLAAAALGVEDVEQIPLYTGQGLPGPWFRVLAVLDSNGQAEFYRASPRERLEAVFLCLSYISQWKTWLGLLPFFALHMLATGRFPRQRTSLERLRERPHPGPLLYERRGFLTYAEFRTRADHFMRSDARARRFVT